MKLNFELGVYERVALLTVLLVLVTLTTLSATAVVKHHGEMTAEFAQSMEYATWFLWIAAAVGTVWRPLVHYVDSGAKFAYAKVSGEA